MDIGVAVVTGVGLTLNMSVAVLSAVVTTRVQRSVGSNAGSTLHEHVGRIEGLLEAHLSDDGRHWVG